MPFASNFGFFKDAPEGDVRFRDGLSISIKTDNAGTSNNDQYTLGAIYGTYLVNWGDGNIETITNGSTPSTTHTYASAGSYVVKFVWISDNILKARFVAGDDATKILSVNKWGTNPLFAATFLGATNLRRISSIDSPPFSSSNYTFLKIMFANCSSLSDTGTLSTWDVSNVTDMDGMFNGASLFNTDLSSWTTFSSSLNDLSFMFKGATAFNNNISTWDTSGIQSFESMFEDATSFDYDISSWDMGLGNNFKQMFKNATSFNQNIGSWTFTPGAGFTGQVAYGMFEGASAFNQDIGSWYTGRLQYNMGNMFKDATVFNQDLTGWCVDLLPSAPANFNQNSALTSANLPVWGTCP